MSAPRLIIFDCDGTLVDSQHNIVSAMQSAFTACGLAPPSREDVLGIVGLSLVEAATRLAPKAGPGAIEGLVQGYKDAFRELRRGAIHHEPLYPGIGELVAALAGRDGVVLGIATGKSRRGVAHVFDLHGLHAHFLTIQTADTHPSKPHPSMVLQAMSETGARPEGTIMIGDTTFDVEMGRRAGVTAVGVAWGYHAVHELKRAGAHAVVDDAAALERTLALLMTEGDAS